MRAPTPPAGAVAHYERGRKEYLAGRYREALQELKAALALDPHSPNLVYNVARVNEDLSEFDEAIKYYKQYRNLLPEDAAEERDKTAKTIRRLQGAKDQLEQQRRNEPQNSPPPAPSSGRADTAFWLLAGTGLALAAGGGVTGFLAIRREQEVRDFVVGQDGTVQDREELGTQATELALASDVMSIAAGAALLSAAVLFFARSSDEPASPVEARVSITPRGGMLGMSASF